MNPSTKKWLIRIAPVLVVLGLAWFGFIRLVVKPPMATTPVLIMVWASVLILLLALFPEIADRITKIKVRDFEIELQHAVTASRKELITPDDLTGMELLGQKEGWRGLRSLLRSARNRPTKSVLLVVNIRDGNYVSIPMLFVYVFFLEMFAHSTIVLFVANPIQLERRLALRDIERTSIIGAVSGPRVLQGLLDQFPFLLKGLQNSNNPSLFSDDSLAIPSEAALEQMRSSILWKWEIHPQELTADDVRQWFGEDLSAKSINFQLDDADLKTVREALRKGDKFLLVLRDEHLNSVLEVCHLSATISQRVLTESK